MQPRSMAIVIPMYNEELNAEKCVLAVCSVLNKKVPGSKLVVVNDGSKDQTGAILKKLGSRHDLPLIVVSYEKNRGYGGACLAGAHAALESGFEFGLFMDSDLTNDPELIPLFVEKAKEGNYDLIKASRYVKDGGMKGVPLYRQMITIIGNKVASKLFGMGLKDCTNGFRAVRLSMICKETFVERGFPVIMEELYYLKRQGAKTAEIPYILTSRAASEGKSKFSYSLKTIRAYLKYALLARNIRSS